MTANDIHLLTGAYVLDSLDEADRARFTGHLDECEGCAGEVAELRETVVRLADDSWAVPPPRLRQNVMEQIRATRQVPPVYPLAVEPTRPVTHRQPSAWRKRAAYGLAAAILAVVAGGVTYLVQEQRVERIQAENARVEAILSAPDVAVKAGSVTGGGRVTVITSPSKNAAVVYLSDASEPSSAQAYEFWMIEKGTPRPAALLAAGEGSGRVLVEGLGTTDTLGMTLEKASGATIPTDPILAAIPMT
jgi:anti-sigma factor RsiW